MSKKGSLLSGLLLLAAGLVVFWPGLHGGFIFDDYPNLVEDADWRVDALEFSQWARAAEAGIASGSGRPLAMLSFAANYYFTGLDLFALKLTGLLLHVLNGLLVFILCRRLFELMPARIPAERLGSYAALMVAMAWVVHPLQVSTALYIVQRMEVGAYLGVLLALIAYLAARQRQVDGRRSWPWWLLSLLGWLFGLGFKESALLAPGYAFAIELFGLKFQCKSVRSARALKGVYAVAFGGAAILFTAYILPWAMQPETYASRGFSLPQRLLTQAHVLLHYLSQMLLPLPNRLVFYYDNFPVSTGVMAPPATLVGMLLLSSMLLGSILVRQRWPLVSLGLIWFFCAHALTSNVVPFELAFEHRNYFGLLGIIIAMAQLLAWPARLLLGRAARRLVAAFLVVGLAFLGGLQAHAWGKPFELAYALGSRNPDSLRAGYQLGMAMLDRAGGDHQSPLVDLAIRQFEHAGEQGASPLPEQGMIIALSSTGREVPAAVWDKFRSKLRAHKVGVEQISALRGTLECRIRGLCFYDDQQLLETMLVALDKNPQSALVHVQYANFAWNVAGEPDLAIALMREAVRLDPGQPQYLVNLVQFLRAAHGETGEVLEIERRITVMDPRGAFQDQLR